MGFDIQKVISEMTDVLKINLDEVWDSAGKFAKVEAKKFAENTKEVVEWKLKGEIDEDMARSLIGLHKRSMKMVLTAAKGISLAMADKAIEESVTKVKGLVNSAAGFDLL